MMGRAAMLVLLQLVPLLSLLTAVFGQPGVATSAGVYAGDQVGVQLTNSTCFLIVISFVHFIC